MKTPSSWYVVGTVLLLGSLTIIIGFSGNSIVFAGAISLFVFSFFCFYKGFSISNANKNPLLENGIISNTTVLENSGVSSGVANLVYSLIFFIFGLIIFVLMGAWGYLYSLVLWVIGFIFLAKGSVHKLRASDSKFTKIFYGVLILVVSYFFLKYFFEFLGLT